MIGPGIKKILSLGDCHPKSTSSPQTSNWYFKGSLGKIVPVFSMEPNFNVNVIYVNKIGKLKLSIIQLSKNI